MSIDRNAFTPVSALAGGALIGAAAALSTVLNGRIAGISRILGGLLRPQEGDVARLLLAPVRRRASHSLLH